MVANRNLNQVENQIGQVRRGFDVSFQALGESRGFHRGGHGGPCRGHPDAASWQLAGQIRYDHVVGSDDEPDHLLGCFFDTRDDAQTEVAPIRFSGSGRLVRRCRCDIQRQSSRVPEVEHLVGCVLSPDPVGVEPFRAVAATSQQIVNRTPLPADRHSVNGLDGFGARDGLQGGSVGHGRLS